MNLDLLRLSHLTVSLAPEATTALATILEGTFNMTPNAKLVTTASLASRRDLSPAACAILARVPFAVPFLSFNPNSSTPTPSAPLDPTELQEAEFALFTASHAQLEAATSFRNDPSLERFLQLAKVARKVSADSRTPARVPPFVAEQLAQAGLEGILAGFATSYLSDSTSPLSDLLPLVALAARLAPVEVFDVLAPHLSGEQLGDLAAFVVVNAPLSPAQLSGLRGLDAAVDCSASSLVQPYKVFDRVLSYLYPEPTPTTLTALGQFAYLLLGSITSSWTASSVYVFERLQTVFSEALGLYDADKATDLTHLPFNRAPWARSTFIPPVSSLVNLNESQKFSTLTSVELGLAERLDYVVSAPTASKAARRATAYPSFDLFAHDLPRPEPEFAVFCMIQAPELFFHDSFADRLPEFSQLLLTLFLDNEFSSLTGPVSSRDRRSQKVSLSLAYALENAPLEFLSDLPFMQAIELIGFNARFDRLVAEAFVKLAPGNVKLAQDFESIRLSDISAALDICS